MFIILLKPESLAVGAVWLYALSSLAPEAEKVECPAVSGPAECGGHTF